MKSGFKGTVSWNKDKSEITVQPRNNNLDNMTDPVFSNINMLFILN